MDLLVSVLTTFANEEATGIAALGLDWRVMLLQAGTFVLLYLIFKKFALEKVVSVLDARHSKIEESLKTAEDIEKHSEEIGEETRKVAAKARKDAEAVIARAHSEAGEMLKEAQDDAEKKQEKMLLEARAKIGADVKQAKVELRSELLLLVASATETVLGEKIDSDKDQALIKRALKEVQS